MILCPNCRKSEAIIDPVYGATSCLGCRNRGANLKEPVEFIPEYIKEERKVYKNDIVQPHRKGELSREWLEINGPQAARKRKYSEKEIKNAKNVWSGDTAGFYYKD